MFFSSAFVAASFFIFRFFSLDALVVYFFSFTLSFFLSCVHKSDNVKPSLTHLPCSSLLGWPHLNFLVSDISAFILFSLLLARSIRSFALYLSLVLHTIFSSIISNWLCCAFLLTSFGIKANIKKKKRKKERFISEWAFSSLCNKGMVFVCVVYFFLLHVSSVYAFCASVDFVCTCGKMPPFHWSYHT